MGFIIKNLGVAGLAMCVALPMAAPIAASADTSPTILIETGPSDKPQYRRMIFVRYANGGNYKAYNRREFINLGRQGLSAKTMECTRGKSTSLSDIKAFEKDEAKRKRQGKAPEIRTFCIKNLSNWTDKNKDRYLDPIFASMPYVAAKK